MSTQFFTKCFQVLVLLTIMADKASAQKKTHPAQLKDSKGELVYTIVEQKPEFPKGNAQLFKYLQANIKYPEQAKKDSVEGTVYVGFVVSADGSIIDAQIKRGVNGGCSEEALRVIQSMPKWIPGKEKGKVLAVAYTIPIRFKL